MSNLKVSIVIPNWNGEKKLKKNLPKVLLTKNVEEVIVVDDASTDGSVDLVKKEFPQTKLIEKEKNTGFGSNVNLGVSNANGDLVFLLNTDAVPEPSCIEKVLHHFDNPKVFSVGFNTGGNWSWARFEKGFFWHFQAPLADHEKPKTHETLWVSGGSGIFRKTIWDMLGGFDPIYDPFYVEDLDLGYRARKRGYVNIWDADASVEHYKEKGVIASNFPQKRIQEVSERNMLMFIWKNITSKKLNREHKKALVKRLLIHPKYFSIYLMALKFLPQIKKSRQLEEKEAKLTDEEILERFKVS